VGGNLRRRGAGERKAMRIKGAVDTTLRVAGVAFLGGRVGCGREREAVRGGTVTRLDLRGGGGDARGERGADQIRFSESVARGRGDSSPKKGSFLVLYRIVNPVCRKREEARSQKGVNAGLFYVFFLRYYQDS